MSHSQTQRDNITDANATTPTSNLPERVENTLAELLALFLPQIDGLSVDGRSKEELEQEADDRFDAAFERAVRILEGSGVGSRSKGKDEDDINGSGDLIKKKLIRENNSPEKALRFSTLYSRLLTQTVLTRKWAMLYFLYKLSDSNVVGDGGAAASHGHQARRRQDFHQHHHHHRLHGQQEERYRHQNIPRRPATATANANGVMNSPYSSDGYRPDSDARSAASPTATSSRMVASRLTERNTNPGKAKMGREFIVDSARFNDAFSEAEPGAVASADTANGLRVRSPRTGQRPLSSASAWSARSGLAEGGTRSRESERRREGRSIRTDRIPRSRPDMGLDEDMDGNDDEENGAESIRREIGGGRYTRTTTRTTQQQYRTTRRVNGTRAGTGTSTEVESDFDSEMTVDNDHRSRRRRNQERQQRQQQEGDGSDDNDNFQGQFRINNPPESTLLRGLPNMLQGLPTEHISFVSELDSERKGGLGTGGGDQTMQICLPPTLSAPTISLLHLLAEPALLYHELNAFAEGSSTSAPSSRGADSRIGSRSFHTHRKDHHYHRYNHHRTEGDGNGNAENTETDRGGLVGQSLRAAIGSELRSYLDLVAGLEKQIRSALSVAGDVGDQDEEAGNMDGYDEKRIRRVRKAQKEQMARLAEAGVTLKKCVVLMRDATMKLRLMSAIVHACQGKKGGELISTTHSFATTHGDPFVCSFAERLLSHVTQPFYDMLRQWIYDGELSDPFLEFFVSENAAEDGDHIGGGGDVRKGGATSVWEDKYKLNAKMIPSIVTEEFVNKVFLIGKSLNFIRYGCSDGSWVEHYSKESSRELHYGDTASLERSIGEAYKTTMARLTTLMADKFKLFVHLEALKKYLLLGAGDFIAVLMESLAPNLDRPANTQYRHTLTAQLEHAVRNSNAQHEPADVLGRLDSRMLELSHGEIGWDVFTLEYKVGPPVDVVVTPMAARQYLRVFNFLWRVKRVDFALASTWRRCMTGARGILGSIENNGGRKYKNAVNATNDGGGRKAGPAQPNLASDWKCAHACIAEMIHLVAQLQYYILFEVIEASWAELQTAIRQPECTLDGLITAHARYLTRITRKGLLGSSSSSSSSKKHDKNNSVTTTNTFDPAHANASASTNANATTMLTTTPGPSQPSHQHEYQSHRQTTTSSSSSSSSQHTPDFPVQLHELFKTILAYRDAVDGLYSFSVAEFTRRQERSTRLFEPKDNSINPSNKTSTNLDFNPNPAQDMRSDPTDPQKEEDPMLHALRKRLASLATDFKARVHVLLGDLYAQPDPDLRWLAMVMNFNDVYGGFGGRGGGRRMGKDKGRREREKKDKGREKEKEKA